MQPAHPTLPSVALLALLALAGGRGAHAMVDEASKSIIHEDPGLRPIALACLGDKDLFILEAPAECKLCTGERARARCGHRHASLVCLHHLAEEGRWACARISQPLPATSAWLGRGGGNTLLLADGQELSRLHLVREGQAWKVVRTETVLPWLWLATMTGGATVYPTFAVLPDRSVVVGLERSVLLLPPDFLKAGPGSVRWLLGKPPACADPPAGGAGDPGAGMLVAVDRAGRVLVADRKTRGLIAIDPGLGGVSRLVRAEQWPLPGFKPVDLATIGRQVFVYGQAGAAGPERAFLVGLEPGGKDQPCAISPALETVRGAPFTFTPLGHMALADCLRGRIWFFPNPTAKPAVRAEPAHQEAARAVADAAYSALLKEVEAERAADLTVKTESKGETKDPEQEPEPPAARAGSAGDRKAEAGPGAPAAVPGLGGTPARQPAGAGGPARAGKTAARSERPRGDAAGFRHYPSGLVNQRRIAQMTADLAASPRFGTAFNDWAARQRSRHPVRVAGLADRVGAADRATPLAVPASPPAGLARFTLREAALRRVVKWMLLNAGRANRAEEVAEWQARGGWRNPQFSFGMYENNRCPQVILEVSDLRSVAERIDELRGDPGTSVAGQLDAVDGIVGVRTPKEGPARFGYGLTLVLGEGNRSIAAIHPGGTWAVEHRWSGSAGKAEPAAPAPAPAARTGPPPAVRPKSRLNPLAPEFVMPDPVPALEASRSAQP